jgi:hypothetical protein
MHRWDFPHPLRLAVASGAVPGIVLASAVGAAFALAGTSIASVNTAHAVASGDVTCTPLPYASVRTEIGTHMAVGVESSGYSFAMRCNRHNLRPRRCKLVAPTKEFL